MLRLTRPAAVLAAAALAASCSDTSGTGGETTATLRIQLTDGPGVTFASAVVYIGTITLLPVEGSPEIVKGADTESKEYDLLQLQNGVTADLAEVEVPTGDYRELRMVVDSAYVVLDDPFEFSSGDPKQRWIKIPSGAQSGIKIKLSDADGNDGQDGITIAPGGTILVVDFDVTRNFKVQGNWNTPAGIKDVLFTPVLRAVVRDLSGSIAGTVSETGGAGLPGLVVQATLQGTPDGEDPVVATTATGDDGTYKFPYLAPGTYSVEVLDFEPDGDTTMPRDVEVEEGQDVEGIDFSGTVPTGG